MRESKSKKIAMEELEQITNIAYIKAHLQVNDTVANLIRNEINKYVEEGKLHAANRQYQGLTIKKDYHECKKEHLRKLIIRYPVYKPNLDTFWGRLDYVISNILVYVP